MMKIISRKEAIEQGLTRYFTGKPCKHGHVSERVTSGSDCCECKRLYREENKEKIAESKKRYAQENKEKIAAYKKSHYEANKGEIIAKQKQYVQENKEKRAKYKKEYYEKNKQDILVKQAQVRSATKDRISEASKLYYKANKEKIKGYQRENKDKIRKSEREYCKRNPLYKFVRRTLKRIESGETRYGSRTMVDIEQEVGYTQGTFKQRIESLWLDGMSWGNRNEWHLDHIIPVKQFVDNGVTDVAIINALDNLQPLWAFDNISKHAKPVPQAEFDAFIKRIQAKKAA